MRRVAGVIAAVTVFVSMVRCASAGDDWQWWNEACFEYEVNDAVTIHLDMEQQLVNDMTDFGLHNYTPGITYAFTRCFDLSLFYRFEREKDEGVWADEHRYSLIPRFRYKREGFQAQLKTTIEYRDLEDDDKWRIREKVKMEKEVKIGSLSLVPFISEDVFCDFDAKEINKNRAAVGIARAIRDFCEISIYYMRESVKDGNDWPGINIVGTEIVVPL